MSLLPTVAGKSRSRNKIPETPQPHRLCNGMKSNSTQERIARSLNTPEKNYEQQTSRKWGGADRSSDFHFTCL
jgi:hypothetical protein